MIWIKFCKFFIVMIWGWFKICNWFCCFNVCSKSVIDLLEVERIRLLKLRVELFWLIFKLFSVCLVKVFFVDVKEVVLLLISDWLKLKLMLEVFWLNSKEFWIFVLILNFLVLLRLIWVKRIWIMIIGGCWFKVLIIVLILGRNFLVVLMIKLLLVGFGMMMIVCFSCW